MPKIYDVIIIGSGPSAYAAHQILNSDIDYLVLEGSSVDIEDNNSNILSMILSNCNFHKLNKLLQTPKNNWKIDSGLISNTFTGQNVDAINLNFSNSFHTSNNLGGLSPHWGHQLIRYTQIDLDDIGFKINYNDLVPHYKKIENFVGLSTDKNLFKLNDFFDSNNLIFTDELEINSFAKKVLSRKSYFFNKNKFKFSAPILARVGVSEEQIDDLKWSYYGFNPKKTFDCKKYFSKFLINGKVIIDRKVYKIEEKNNICIIYSKDSLGNHHKFFSKKTLIASGAINTIRIIKNSLNLDNITTPFFDHRTMLLPILSFTKNLKVNTTINELIGINENDKSNHFFSIYSLSSLSNSDIMNIIPLKYPFNLPFINFIRRYMHVMQIWESENIGGIITVDRNGTKIKDNLVNVSIDYKFLLGLVEFGILPLHFLSKFTSYGQGYHYVGTFPFNGKNDIFTTDRLGKLQQFSNVHIIDGSVIPKLSLKNPTLLQMANSSRITNEILNCK